MKGRKPKPTALKKLAGNPGKRPLNESEPSFETSDLRVPIYLIEEEKWEWVRLAPMLLQAGVLTEGDEIALAILCAKLVRWKRARALLRKSGETYISSKGNEIRHPHVEIVTRLESDITKILAEFGLTPSSRTRVMTAAGDEEKSLADALFKGLDEVPGFDDLELADVVGARQAESLAGHGFHTLDRAVYAAQEGLHLEKIKGVGPATVKKLKALE